MKTNTDITSADPSRKNGTTMLQRYYEYFLLLIPSLTIPIARWYFDDELSIYAKVLLSTLFGLPLLTCLIIITIRYRKHDFKNVLFRYAVVGFILPPIFLFSYVIALFTGWARDDGAIGWFIMMVIPVAIVCSIITAGIGTIMCLIVKIIGRCTGSTQ